jgi:hypothetical protein
LAPEHVARWDVDVVRDLQIVGIYEGMINRFRL